MQLQEEGDCVKPEGGYRLQDNVHLRVHIFGATKCVKKLLHCHFIMTLDSFTKSLHFPNCKSFKKNSQCKDFVKHFMTPKIWNPRSIAFVTHDSYIILLVDCISFGKVVTMPLIIPVNSYINSIIIFSIFRLCQSSTNLPVV